MTPPPISEADVEASTAPPNLENDRRRWSDNVEKTQTHRDAQACEALAGRLRKISMALVNTFRKGGDATQLNAQLATLHQAAAILEWMAREGRQQFALPPTKGGGMADLPPTAT